MEKFLKNSICLFIILIVLLLFLIIYKIFPFSLYWQQLLIPFDSSVVQENEDTSLPSEEPPLKTTTRASLFMVGDALIHSAVYADADTGNGYDFRPMIEEVKEISKNYDLAFYNQETILGGSELGLSSYPRFNSPYEVGDAFVDAGFNLVSLANNHTLDRGETAILNSHQYWKQYPDVMTAGSFSSRDEMDQPNIGEVNGISYAFFAYTDWTNGLVVPAGKDYLLARYSNELAKQDIEKVRDQVDVVIVSMHFGDEYSFSVSSRQRGIATYLASLGVDIVIGHHPHVVEPIEMIDDTLVIYSLGNFISAQRGVEKLTGMMFSLDIVKTTEAGVSKVSLENMKAGLVYTYSDTINGIRRNFKVYPYQNLTEELLPNHEMYYNKYMNLILQNVSNVERW